GLAGKLPKREAPMTYRVLRSIFFAAGIGVLACPAQDSWDAVNFRSAQVEGLKLYGVSVYSSYSTLGFPGVSLQQLSSAQNVGGDWNYGSQWTAGWQRLRDRTSFSVLYNGLYGHQQRYTSLSSFGHSLALGANRTFGNWSLEFAASADYRSVAQALFLDSSLGLISQVPGSSIDLSAAFGVGQFSS